MKKLVDHPQKEYNSWRCSKFSLFISSEVTWIFTKILRTNSESKFNSVLKKKSIRGIERRNHWTLFWNEPLKIIRQQMNLKIIENIVVNRIKSCRQFVSIELEEQKAGNKEKDSNSSQYNMVFSKAQSKS